MSVHTRTCASHSGPAPMPTVGTGMSAVTRLATCPGHVLPDQHLGVDVGTRADADRGDGQPLRHLGRDLGDDHLEHDGERAGLGDGAGVGEQLLGGVLPAALHAVAAEGVLALRGEAEVRHHRDAGVDDGPDAVGVVRAALELDRVGAAALHELDGGRDGLLDRDLVAPERQVGDHEGVRGPAHHGSSSVVTGTVVS